MVEDVEMRTRLSGYTLRPECCILFQFGGGYSMNILVHTDMKIDGYQWWLSQITPVVLLSGIIRPASFSIRNLTIFFLKDLFSLLKNTLNTLSIARIITLLPIWNNWKLLVKFFRFTVLKILKDRRCSVLISERGKEVCGVWGSLSYLVPFLLSGNSQNLTY